LPASLAYEDAEFPLGGCDHISRDRLSRNNWPSSDASFSEQRDADMSLCRVVTKQVAQTAEARISEFLCPTLCQAPVGPRMDLGCNPEPEGARSGAISDLQ
jgi:hypothetical protein